MKQHFKIAGTGHYRPQTIVTPQEMDSRLGKPPGWTEQHSGIDERRECLPHETIAHMACAAIEQAMTEAEVEWSEIDLIIDCSNCRQQPIPCNAALIQAAIGPAALGIPCFDVQSTCLGFLVALEVANGLLAAESCQTILIVCSEASLSGVNWKETESASLMSDAAAAAVLKHHAGGGEFRFVHETHAEHADVCEVVGGGHKLGPFEYRPDIEDKYRFHMDGPRLFRIARKLLPPMVETLIASSAYSKQELFVIPHQASPRGVELIRRALGLDHSRYADRVRQFGNTIAASIPLVLDICRREGTVGEGDPLMLLGTSAGYSQAAMIFSL